VNWKTGVHEGLIPCLLAFMLADCSGANEGRTTRSSTAAATKQTPFDSNGSCKMEAPKDEAMPGDLLVNNIRTTDYTAVICIISAKANESENTGIGYNNHIYKARVLETIKGEQLDIIEYSVVAERGIQVRKPNYPLIVSLCGSIKAGFHVPDNGYESSAPRDLVEIARHASINDAKFSDASSVCGK
jgi:hypothetical protein